MKFFLPTFSVLNKGAAIAGFALLFALSGPIDFSYAPETSEDLTPPANSALNYQALFVRV